MCVCVCIRRVSGQPPVSCRCSHTVADDVPVPCTAKWSPGPFVRRAVICTTLYICHGILRGPPSGSHRWKRNYCDVDDPQKFAAARDNNAETTRGTENKKKPRYNPTREFNWRSRSFASRDSSRSPRLPLSALLFVLIGRFADSLAVLNLSTAALFCTVWVLVSARNAVAKSTKYTVFFNNVFVFFFFVSNDYYQTIENKC